MWLYALLYPPSRFESLKSPLDQLFNGLHCLLRYAQEGRVVSLEGDLRRIAELSSQLLLESVGQRAVIGSVDVGGRDARGPRLILARAGEEGGRGMRRRLGPLLGVCSWQVAETDLGEQILVNCDSVLL